VTKKYTLDQTAADYLTVDRGICRRPTLGGVLSECRRVALASVPDRLDTDTPEADRANLHRRLFPKMTARTE